MLPIYLYGHPVLRNVSEEIGPDYPSLGELIQKMKESMYESDGIGLAAPQIGKNIRLIVVDARPMGKDFPECGNLEMVLINPRIQSYSEETCSEYEGCLSLPGISEQVVRPHSIRLTWQDELFTQHEEIFSGFAARVIQHEYDHIEGKVFTDHLSPLRKQLIKSKLSNIQKGKTTAHYPTVVAPSKKKF